MRVYKVAFVGSSGVGKTAIALEAKRNRYRSTILALHRKSLVVDSVVLAMDILDTSGSEEYVSVRDEAIRASDGFVVIYSIISGDSFKFISKMNHDIKTLKGLNGVPIVLVANKLDLASNREVPHLEGEVLARDWCCPFFETFVSEERLRAVYETIVREMNKSTAISWKEIEQPVEQEYILSNTKERSKCVII